MTLFLTTTALSIFAMRQQAASCFQKRLARIQPKRCLTPCQRVSGYDWDRSRRPPLFSKKSNQRTGHDSSDESHDHEHGENAL